MKVSTNYRYQVGLENQHELTIALLSIYGNLNTLELKSFGVANPSQRVHELIKMGYVIDAVYENFADKLGEQRKQIARYHLRKININSRLR